MRVGMRLQKWFGVHEIIESKVLQWAFGAVVFAYYIAFAEWISSPALSVDTYLKGVHSCWPHFQSCGEYFFLRALPLGYSQTLFYMVLFSLLIGAVYAMARKEWGAAHAVLVPVWVWHVLGTFVLTDALAGNYDYYLAVFGGTLLFIPHKEFFLKLYLVLFYVLSVAVKIHEGWVVGTYFTSLATGLPLFPEWSVPFFTNMVMWMELVGAWFLLGKDGRLRHGVFSFFVIFHLYSGILVQYRYPSTVLPMLLILFGPWYTHTRVPFDVRSIAGWAIVALLFSFQFVAHVIPGDEKLTMEANRYGLYMFEANHQCVSRATVVRTDGTREDLARASYSARNRCNPYHYWFRLQTRCARDEGIERVVWTFDHSVNGNPFLRIVDVQDACVLSYAPFTRNTWIRTQDEAPAVGVPYKNLYD